MSILALLTDAFGSRGGICEYNQNWLRALAGRDAARELNVVVTRGGAHVEGNITQEQIRGRAAYLAAAWRRAGALSPSDLILCGHLSLLPVAALAARRCGAPVWLQVHGIEAWQLPSRLVRRCLPVVRLVTAVSRFTRRRFLSWSHLDPMRIRVLPNTLGTDCNVPSQPGERRVRQVLSVGRLDSREGYKGHDRIIRALPEVNAHVSDFEYLVVGEGDDQPRLKALARSLDVRDQVRFLGRVSRANLLALYRNAHLFAMPSTGEGFGIVYLEALACGCPVLGLGIDGSADPLTLPGAVTCSESELSATLVDLLCKPRLQTDRQALMQRFGPEIYASQVAWLQDELSGASQ